MADFRTLLEFRPSATPKLGAEEVNLDDGGVARKLAKLLPKNPVYAPNGYRNPDENGNAVALLKKPSEM